MIIWILFRGKITPIQFYLKQLKCNLKQLICDAFELSSYNFRLRNSKGNVIAIENLIESNTKKDPYILEVYTPKIGSKPSQNRVTTANASRHIIQMYKNRILKLETLINDDSTKHDFNNKLKQIENQINFIEKRINLVQLSDWNGFFKKPILW